MTRYFSPYYIHPINSVSVYFNYDKTFSLNDLEQFIAYATKELQVELGEEDYEGLLRVMGVLNEVRAKVDAQTETMFEPLREIIDVLKDYGVDFPEETYEQVLHL